MPSALMEREERVSPLRRFSLDLDRLFDDFGFRPRFFRREVSDLAWVPDLEIFERNGRFNVRADLPGLTKDDVKVKVDAGMLTIEGERKQESETKREGYYRSERSYGTFYRAIPLPDGSRTDQIQATFKNCVLEISLPFSAEDRMAKTVDVKVM